MAAFTTSPRGGNPAGVWIGDALPPEPEMQRIAAETGYPNTAFLAPAQGEDRIVRYFSPAMPVGFCGHATIASGVILGQTLGAGTYRFSTPTGEVPVAVRERDGQWEVSLTSVLPKHEPAAPALIARVLESLEWPAGDLDRSIPPARIYAGNWHLALAARTADRLADLDYDFDRLKAVMSAEGLATIQLVWRERVDLFHSRNPFPVGGVVEDPASGSAAAAFAGYLRDARLIETPASIVILQGEAMGRPSRIEVEIPRAGGIVVTGHAVAMDEEAS